MHCDDATDRPTADGFDPNKISGPLSTDGRLDHPGPDELPEGGSGAKEQGGGGRVGSS